MTCDICHDQWFSCSRRGIGCRSESDQSHVSTTGRQQSVGKKQSGLGCPSIDRHFTVEPPPKPSSNNESLHPREIRRTLDNEPQTTNLGNRALEKLLRDERQGRLESIKSYD
ncbi:hypothetical protein AVEN_143620-1 [Araneus ventricosus]|uniref:Uncharacterized protein n=1 Tax=Araneus ventricosus TaxID=182803 RepID=A0A4Y2ANB3_ARAVE|nr:hypothetical protein AVEN_143620-1 [Araneus ventricosus]